MHTARVMVRVRVRERLSAARGTACLNVKPVVVERA